MATRGHSSTPVRGHFLLGAPLLRAEVKVVRGAPEVPHNYHLVSSCSPSCLLCCCFQNSNSQSCLRVFAVAVPSAQNVLPPGVCVAHSLFSYLKSLLRSHLLREASPDYPFKAVPLSPRHSFPRCLCSATLSHLVILSLLAFPQQGFWAVLLTAAPLGLRTVSDNRRCPVSVGGADE